jgi:hypothetical protein
MMRFQIKTLVGALLSCKVHHLRETRARVFSGQAAATLKDWDFTSMIYARLKACVCVPNKQMHMREPQSPAQQISRMCLLPTAALMTLKLFFWNGK